MRLITFESQTKEQVAHILTLLITVVSSANTDSHVVALGFSGKTIIIPFTLS
jgi:hypothetical protein